MGYPHDDLLKGLRKANKKRLKRWHPKESEPWSLADYSNAMCGEAGEAANVVKKIRRIETMVAGADDHKLPELLQALGKELADVAIYLDILANEAGIDLRRVIIDKFNEVSEKRGFPERLYPSDYGY